ncbi:MAG: M20/M25/M40 family metallo-hydrolase [Planctomycetes bacterium]|nr:M20/M25/M40 family metallo-hydrolase [Planctomycetota bacterium]
MGRLRPLCLFPCRLACALVLFALAATGLYGEELRNAVAERMMDHVKFLASDELEGRGVGTKGLDRAAEFVRDEFEKAGLDVTRVDGGAFQPFTMTTDVALGEKNELALIGPSAEAIELKYDKDFRTCSFGDSGEFEADLVFAGYAIEDDEYNDLKDVDLKGKVALVVRRVPQQALEDGPFSTPHGPSARHASLLTKVSNVFRKGAVAVLIVNDPYTSRADAERLTTQTGEAHQRLFGAAEAFEAADPKNAEEAAELRKKLLEAVAHLRALAEQAKPADDDPLVEFGYGGRARGKSVPVFHITRDAADRILVAAAGRTLEQIEADIDSDLKPRSAPLSGWKARGAASLKPVEAQVKNVIGVLEGDGPLADETVVIGAHYDHVGMGGTGSLAPGSNAVHNGADDNASGVAGLIELARRFAAREQKPARRLVFIAFTAEERGLIGSAHYVKEPLVPLENTIAMFNMDMIGRLRDDKLTVFGTGTAPHWKDAVVETARAQGLETVLKPEGFGPSDHSSFYGKKIPVLHFFTNNHADYHRPSDDWDKINADGMARVIAMLEDLIEQTLTAKERPQYIEIKERAEIARTGSRPYFGSIPDFGSETPGYALQGVAKDSPAEQAGLKGGDVIVQFGDSKIGSLNDFDLALRNYEPGDEVDVVVTRDGSPLKLKVTLGRPRN